MYEFDTIGGKTNKNGPPSLWAEISVRENELVLLWVGSNIHLTADSYILCRYSTMGAGFLTGKLSISIWCISAIGHRDLPDSCWGTLSGEAHSANLRKINFPKA